MNEAQLRELVRRIIISEIGTLSMATIAGNTSQNRSAIKRYASESSIPNTRTIMPFGISTKSPAGTEALVTPIGGNGTNLAVLGHFDKSRPSVEDGETKLYGADGQVIYLKNGGTIHQGSDAAAEPVVLGNVIKEMLEKHYNDLIAGPIGYDVFALPVFTDPSLVTKLTEDIAKYITDAGTNIVGQKNFVERGG